MKIAWVAFDFIEYSIPHLNELARNHQVMAFLPSNQMDGMQDTLSKNVDFHGFHKPRFRQPLRQFRMLRQLKNGIKRFSPDVIHFQQGHMYFNWMLPWLTAYPLVLTIHDPRYHPGDKDSRKTPQWVMDFGFRRANRVIVHGSEMPELIEREIGVSKQKIHLIPHIAIGLPEDIPSGNCFASLSPQPTEVSHRPQKILFFGRIWQYKGLEYLIRAQPLINQQFPEAVIVIGGRGDDFDKYRAMMVDPARFEIHNDWIDDQQRARLFSEADIVVLPYIEATQSGVVPIAYAHRKPVIATRVGGLPDVVEHGVTGLLVAPRDVQQLADATKQLLSDSALSQRMGLAGREKLKQECGPEVVVRQTLAVYQAAIEDRGKRLCVALSE